jgi:NAD(P)H-hydrate epimerase
MRASEQAAFAAGLDSFIAMQRAGEAVAEVIQQDWMARPVLVLCGSGNNGGDGYIVAHALRLAGWPVSVLASAAPTTLDARRAAALWGDVPAIGNHGVTWPGEDGLIVDALFGIGLTRPISGETASLIAQANAAAAPVIAIDIPSGVNADSGEVLGTAIQAALTVTFAWAKPGHLLLPGRGLAGELVVADIGLPAAIDLAGGIELWSNRPDEWQAHLPVPGAASHKFTRGHLVAVGGAVMTGAVRLAVRATRRAGVGLATVLAPASAVAIYAADQAGIIVRSRPDTAMPVPGTSISAGSAGEQVALSHVLADDRVTAVLIGSGLPPSGDTTDLLREALASGRPLVIDGGGLDAMATLSRHGDAAGGGTIAGSNPGIRILTPHEGEFRRLCPDLTIGSKLGGSKLDRALAAAERFDAIVVLKGADTVIAAPDHRAAINGAAPAYLATAGSGDVLAGIIAGLLAQGMPAFAAACAGVWLHAEAARLFGPGLIAEDLPDLLPSALAGLLKDQSN